MTEQIFQASDAVAGDQFGTAVALSRDKSTLVIGAPWASGGFGAGAVYVYTGPGFATETKLVASDPGGFGDQFGCAVAVSDDGKVILVGRNNNFEPHGPGQAYVFSGPGWATETILTASDGAAGDDFGAWVGLSGDGLTAAAGAPGAAALKGAAYVYTGAGYVTETILTASDGVANDQFGVGVSLSQDGATLATGSIAAAAGHANAGKVYVYSGVLWATETILAASVPVAGQFWGAAIGVSDDGSVLVVGSFTDHAYVRSGAAYATETPLTASDGTGGNEFGLAVAVSGDGAAALVGAQTQVEGGNATGEAYLYTGVIYASERKIAASDAAADALYGIAVACIDASFLIVGAAAAGLGGQAYLYLSTIPPPPPGRVWRAPGRGRIIVTDLLGQVTTWLDFVHLGAQIPLNLNQPSTITVALRPNNRAVNTLYTDGDPLVAQSNRLVYVFLREGGSTPWVCRAAGIAMSPEDQGDPDVPTTHLVAYDPWTYVAGRPFYSDNGGTLPGPDGFLFPATRGGVIIATALKNAIEFEGVGCYVDAGPAYGGTIFWNGVIEDTPILDYKVQQGQSIADIWNGVIAAGDPSGGPGGADIILTPIYDPTLRPGFTHELSVYNLAGQVVPSSPMAWGEFTRVATVADRQHDGTPGAFINQAYYYAGQGGFPVGLVDNALSVAKYKPYRATQFFPQQLEGDVVQAFAHQAITLAKQGKRTFTVDPDPMRAPAPFTGYNLGDRIPQLAPKTLRVAATGYQRIQTIPLEINPDGVTRVRQLLTTPDWRGDDGT